MSPPRFPAALLGLLLCSPALGAAKEGQPRAAVVLLGAKGLAPKEVELVLQSALQEIRASSGFYADSSASLSAGVEVATLGCELEPECLLRAAEALEMDAVIALRASVPRKKEVSFEVLWVSGDARGLPGEAQAAIERTAAAIEAGVRAGVRSAIPRYARKGVGGLSVLAPSGSEVLVDGQPAGKAPLSEPLVLSAGVHRVDIVTAQGQRAFATGEVREGRKSSVEVSAPSEAIAALTAPPPPEPKGKGLRTTSYVMGGAGAASLGVGLYFGLQSLALNGQIRGGTCGEVPCPEGMTQLQAQKLSDQSSGNALLGNLGLTTGLALVGGAAVIYWLGGRDE